MSFALVGVFHGGNRKLRIDQIFEQTVKTFGPFETEDEAYEFNRMIGGEGGAGVIWVVIPLRDPRDLVDPSEPQ